MIKDPHTTPHPSLPGRAVSGRMLPTLAPELEPCPTCGQPMPGAMPVPGPVALDHKHPPTLTQIFKSKG